MKTKAPKRQPAPKATRKRKADDPEQFEHFVEATRKAGVDESGEAFDRAFDKIVRPRKTKGS
jgi:hypothetical protein